jgi:hypothetical protein
VCGAINEKKVKMCRFISFAILSFWCNGSPLNLLLGTDLNRHVLIGVCVSSASTADGGSLLSPAPEILVHVGVLPFLRYPDHAVQIGEISSVPERERTKARQSNQKNTLLSLTTFVSKT